MAQTEKILTMEDWKQAGSFTHLAKPGDAVVEEIVDEFVNCLPPMVFERDFVQAGEAYGTGYDPKQGRMRMTYITFKRKDRQWYYCGCCFYREDVDRCEIS